MMREVRAAVMLVRFLLLVLLLASCRRSASTADAGPASTGAVPRTVFPALGVSMVLPPDAQSTQRDDGVSIAMRPGILRYMPTLVLERARPEKNGGKTRLTLRNGAELSYEIRHHEAQGSGEPSVELVGIVRLGHLVMRVRCEDQADQVPPEKATWCLPVLETLREEGAITGLATPRSPEAKLACSSLALAPDEALIADAPPSATETVVAGANACARTSDGAVWCWGANESGQVGDGTRMPRPQPVRVELRAPARSVTLGSFGVALDVHGDVWQWGHNRANRRLVKAPDRVGPPSSAANPDDRPARVPGVRGAVQVEAGGFHACARDRAGAVFCWGYGHYGQLGDGTTALERVRAVRVAHLPPVAEIATGFYYTCARDETGAVWCWGNGWGGEDGTDARLLRPSRVAELGSATEIIATPSAICARRRGDVALTCCSYTVEDGPESDPSLVCAPFTSIAKGCATPSR